MERELGQGATAFALLVKRNGEECVLKIARTEEDNDRLRQEAEVLKKLRSDFIVDLEEVVELRGRVTLVLESAGDRTLAQWLREEGPLSFDLLQRFGTNLLEALASLERRGIPHRDIKPANIGVVSPQKKKLQLVLFDFSLSRAPADNIHVGTGPYLDPFLSCREPARWDQAAERYSAAVTLYEMATAQLPQWGDGQSDPAVTDAVLNLAAEQFPDIARDQLIEFFERALHRDPKKRFDNAEEMKDAWKLVFDEAEQQTITTATGEEVNVEEEIKKATPETLLAVLGLSARAINALDRVNVLKVSDLLSYPLGDIHTMRGVGHKTRREIVGVVDELRMRLPEFRAAAKFEETKIDREVDEGDLADLTLDELHARVMGRKPAGRSEGQWRIRTTLLGLNPERPTQAGNWPSQRDVAGWLKLTSGRIGQVVMADRKRWTKDAALTCLRQDVLSQLHSSGGVMTARELAEWLRISRKTDMRDEEALRLASAIGRVAVETEQGLADPRFLLRRSGNRVLVACSPDLASYAGRLGEEADKIAAEDPLPPRIRISNRLAAVAPPREFPQGCSQPTPERLVHLAAAASETAAVSTRQELYPRGMSAERALRLGIGAITGLGLEKGEGQTLRFTAEDVRRRIVSRYPEVERIPDHPELDELLEKVGFDAKWNAKAGQIRAASARGGHHQRFLPAIAADDHGDRASSPDYSQNRGCP